MPVPNAMSDLSQLAGSNYPVGSEAIGNNLDNYLRAHAALIKQSNSIASSTMPAGSTVNVALADAESVTITGDASISSLGTGFNGCKRELRFTGSPQLIHSSALQLPAAASFTVTPGQVHTFRCIGSNSWVLVCTSLAPGFLTQWATLNPNSKQDALGFQPVQQGGGVGQGSNKIYVGWGDNKLRAQVDDVPLGPIATENWVNAGFAPLSGATFTGRLKANGFIDGMGGVANSTYPLSFGGRIRSEGATSGLVVSDRSNSAVEWQAYADAGFLYLNHNTTGNQVRFSSGGEIFANGNVIAFSDERLKSGIKTICDPLEILRGLRGTTYSKEGKPCYGVIAQEVRKKMPEIVFEYEENGLLGVAAGNEIPAVLIEAVKELAGRLDLAGL